MTWPLVLPQMVYWGVVGFLALLLVRNWQVFRYRRRLLRLIRVISERETEAGLPPTLWRERLKLYEAVTYNRMFWTFWRPLRAFYDERALFTSPLGFPPVPDPLPPPPAESERTP